MMLVADQVKDAEIIDKNNGRDGMRWEAQNLGVWSQLENSALNDLNNSFISFRC